LHEIPSDIVLDRDQRFDACFWQAVQKAFATKLNFNSSYHTEIDGQNEIVN